MRRPSRSSVRWRSCASALAWLEARPLHGRTIAVTRARPQASALAARLRELGAEVVEAPAIRVAPVEAALPDLAGYDLVCITSPNGAHELFARLAEAGLDARALAGRPVAAIGPGTARALGEHGIVPDVVPGAIGGGGPRRGAGGRPGVARAGRARPRGPRRAARRAARPRGDRRRARPLRDGRGAARPGHRRARPAAADYVTFTSASTVRFFLAATGGLSGPRLVSIGPATSAALREAGLAPDVEADPHTPDGLVAALLADASRGQTP